MIGEFYFEIGAIISSCLFLVALVYYGSVYVKLFINEEYSTKAYSIVLFRVYDYFRADDALACVLFTLLIGLALVFIWGAVLPILLLWGISYAILHTMRGVVRLNRKVDKLSKGDS